MDARAQRTKAAIKDALLTLMTRKRLEAVTMAELASAAHISRSTLYGYYGNVREVFDDAVVDFCHNLRSLGVQLRCGQCGETRDGTRPFCIALRDAGKYQPLVADPSFLPAVLDHYGNATGLQGAEDALEGLDPAVKRALFLFQMSGCYQVAMDKRLGTDWSTTQALLDTYVQGGVNAVRKRGFPNR